MKSLVKDEYCEVICGVNNEHRADIKTPKYAIELQFSHISLSDAKARTIFYKNLTGNRVIWVINCFGPSAKGHIQVGEKVIGTNFHKLYWKYQKKWAVDLSESKDTHIYLDISINSDKMLRVWKHEDCLYCQWINKQDFYNQYLKSVGNDNVNIKSVFTNLKINDYV